ncbi:MAG: asparagine synthase (glutamine-hydrolyzing) [Nocardioidaceae bacterium]
MCGLVGLLEDQDDARSALIRRMNATITHRGPDEDGYFEDPEIAMGMRRLSIQDVVHGHQPRFSEDGSIVAMMNGEIYNTEELRRLLETRGHQILGTGDTELLPHLYEEFGLDFVQHLRGMFAIALWDKQSKQLILVRDRLGKKPLYYWLRDGRISWASELKALLADPRLPRRPDLTAINHYLSFKYVPAPLSAVENVNKLPPAHMLVMVDGAVKIHRYWRLNYAPQGVEIAKTDAELAEELRANLIDAVKVRMISERPVGAFLSGGLDSSAVVAAMRHAGVDDIKTFSIGFDEDEYNELPHARRVAERYETDHHELIVRMDVTDIVPRLATMYDEPYADSSAIPTWYLSEMTRKEVVVALNGDGGDEALAGYQWHAITSRAPQVRFPTPVASLLKRVGAGLRHHSDRSRVIDKASKAALMMAETTGARRYARFVSYLRQEDKLQLATDNFAQVVRGSDSLNIIEEVWNDHLGTDLVNRLLAVDTSTYLPGDLNVKVDIATMSVSLEARSPFLDHQFMEWAASIPGDRKLKPGSTKHLLKLALEGWIDDDLIHRTKRGFGIPQADWLRGPLRELTYDSLTDSTAASRGLFEPKAINALLTEHMSGVDLGSEVYTLLMLELWFREVLDAPSAC